ncbi:MAG: Cobalamin B12-binding domain protein [Acetothermia bacterium 64_32]|nr:MAG: Cobalamin B12-binding domain protein [Acetothermia bacterium 64_32]HAF70821.1 cobalamin-binding protein [Candidatus Acetothermia bacterium]
MLEKLKQAVLEGDSERAAQLTKEALEKGLEPERILNDALVAAMEVVGEEYERGDRYVPEMLISAEAMKAAMEVLRPELVAAGVKPRGKVVIGTVEGDLHDIGKNLVAMMLEGAGFEVVDLGTEVTAERFVQAAREHRADIVGMSALLTTTMTHMPEVIEALKREGLRDGIKVMVGGAPVTQEYAERIGADGYAPDAASAVELAKRLLGES